MRRRRFKGRLIGLLAAYLVALQALGLPLSIAPTAAFAAHLCLTDSSGAPAQNPRDQDRNCPCCAGCAMQCQQPALDAALPAAVPAPKPQVIGVLAAAPPAAAPPLAVHLAQMPRGPPAA